MDISALMAALEGLLLERLPDGRFIRRGALPAWCLGLRWQALRDETPFVLGELFPFLDTFMETAEAAWRSETGGRVSSGFWTDEGMDDQDIHLEAHALRVGQSEVLVVVRNERLFQDKQRLLQRARELRLAHDALLREIEQKDVLLHAIIHELASPLHPILGMLSLLDEAPSGEHGPHAIGSALAAARRQKEVISEVLEAFSAEYAPPAVALAGAAPDVHRIMSQVAREREPVAERRDVRLEVEPRTSSCHVLAEESRLVRVLANLVDNALYRSPAGAAVRLMARREGAWVYVAVDDQGAPVPLERLPRLFGTFALRKHRKTTDGGFGLYFCRITVERWGGGIGYEPSERGGARFWVRLQAAEGGREPTGPGAVEPRSLQESDSEPPMDGSGPVGEPVGAASDAADARAVEERVARSLSTLQAAVEATADGILAVDRTGRITLVNQRLLALWNLSAQEVEAADESALLDAMLARVEDPDGFRAGVLGLQDQPEREYVDIVRLQDGRVYERHARPQRTGDAVVGRIWSYRDISDRERCLRRALFLADATRLLVSVDVERALDAVARLMVPDLADGCIIDLFDGDEPRRSLAVSRDPRSPIALEVHPSVLAGQPILYQVGSTSYLGVPIGVKDRLAGAMTLAAPPHHRYTQTDLELAEELGSRIALCIDNARLHRRAQEALRARDEFLSIASHEIRGPITSLHLAVQMLRRGQVPEQARDTTLELIEREGRRLARFVDELLDVGRIRAGTLRFALEDVDLGEIVREVTSRLGPDLARAGSALTLEIEDHVRGEWDRLRLDQIVTNLLSNAIKFGMGKPISVSVSTRDDFAVLAVRDRGMGVAADKQARMFRPFERGVSVRHYGGLGLGLYIVQTLVDGLGGHISVESALGIGSTFTVELPRRRTT